MEPFVRLLVATDSGERKLGDGFSDAPLPGGEREGGGLTYGRYLAWLRRSLVEKNPALLARVASRLTDIPGEAGPVTGVDLVAEKHGAWYHPARVRIFFKDREACLCANAALSPRAAAQAAAEHRLLSETAAARCLRFVPESFGVLAEPLAGREAAVLLTEYFPGAYEFHLRTRRDGPPGLFLWDTDRGPRYLSDEESDAVYFQAARILAYYYDPESCREIHPWHHAAGDFVFRPGLAEAPLRLITVRSFSPVFGMSEEAGDAGLLLGLFFYLVSVSMRTRIDRDNGTGETVTAGPACVHPTLRGFLSGLDQSCEERGAEPLAPALRQLMAGLSEKQVKNACEAEAEAVPPESPDAGALAGLAEGHAKELLAAFAEPA